MKKNEKAVHSKAWVTKIHVLILFASKQKFKSKIIIYATVSFEFECYFIIIQRIPWACSTHIASILTILAVIYSIQYDLIITTLYPELSSSPIDKQVIGTFKSSPALLIIFIPILIVGQSSFFGFYLTNELVVVVIATFNDFIIAQLFWKMKD